MNRLSAVTGLLLPMVLMVFSDFAQAADADQYDVVYARFLLTHLRDPRAAVEALHRHLRPGGLVAVEDIDFSGSFAYPPSKAFARYWELYCAVVDRRGGDPNIGPKLPLLLEACGFDAVDVSIVQPAGMRGDAKLIGPLTMENIADSVIADGLAARDEIDALVRDMYAYVSDPKTITGLPRVVQAWGWADVLVANPGGGRGRLMDTKTRTLDRPSDSVSRR